MVRFWALAVTALTMLGVAAQVIAEEAPAGEAGFAAREPAAGRVYHVDEYTQAAILRYPGLKAADADIDAAQARLNEARLSPFMQFQGQARFFVAPGARGTATFSPDPQIPWSNRWGPGGEIGVEGAIPIYTFGKYRAGKKAATAGISASEYERDRTLARVVFDVRRAYFGTQLSLDLQTMISEGKNKLRTAVEKLDARLKADDPRVKQTDYWRLVSALSEIESRESEALRLEASARAALEILSGLKPAIVPECPLESVQSEVIELGEHIERALESRPEVHQLEAARTAKDANLTVKRAGYLPDIVLALRASYQREGQGGQGRNRITEGQDRGSGARHRNRGHHPLRASSVCQAAARKLDALRERNPKVVRLRGPGLRSRHHPGHGAGRRNRSLLQRSVKAAHGHRRVQSRHRGPRKSHEHAPRFAKGLAPSGLRGINRPLRSSTRNIWLVY
jgi:outer membrane protein TolC